ncbi:HNH endonuclease signature motif containing protein [Microbacterium pumilum]|uniref:DUF222 domain-containing protein n=1 Tax=Microbacterium pumilum TaxID=344165 RepID=A0ABP5E0V5_9MICO
MSIIERITEAGDRMASRFVTVDEVAELETFDDEAVLALIADATDARKAADVLISAASSIVARRSDRAFGQAGLAQRKGHRTPTALVQHITGQSRGHVFRSVQTGEDLRDAAARRSPVPASSAGAAVVADAWHKSLTDALTDGALTNAQYDAIRRSLGEPPVDRYQDVDPASLQAAWYRAATMLIDEAAVSAIEDLRAAARTARDRLDPIGVSLRFDERYENRSFRVWIDETGQHNARLRFDDEAGAWVQTVLSAAMRRRRGPRFVPASGALEDAAPDVACPAEVGIEDERSKEQIQYDSLIAILRTGAAADPDQAFGDRQPGIRIVSTVGPGGEAATVGANAYLEDGGQALPASIVEKYLCDAGWVDITVDSSGNPLDVGREKRLFTAKQRTALRIRDGGCLWPGCPEPPSHCEAHHSEHWAEHRGRTDVDLGVMLCMFHHLRLHNQGWKITRRDGSFWLHPPPNERGGTGGPLIRLITKAPGRFAAA